MQFALLGLLAFAVGGIYAIVIMLRVIHNDLKGNTP